MKNIKRCAKYERKFESDSDTSSDKQGTYYQFLVEKKVPNGTLRHIASLINVTYEYIPDNYQIKRQKIKEDDVPTPSSIQEKKENLNQYGHYSDNLISEDLYTLQNLELKMLEDKPNRRMARTSEKKRKSHAFLENVPFRGSDWRTRADTDVITICKKANKPMSKSKSSTIGKDHHLPFLRNQKLTPWNLKMGNHKKEKWSNPQCNEKAKYFITYVNKGERIDSVSKLDFSDIPMKKSKSLAYQGKDNSLNHAIKRNPRVKYVKADVFRKHEKIREQLFEDKIWELVNQADSHEEDRNDSSYKDNNLNFQRTLMENSWGIHSLNDEAGDENDPENGEFVIAQDYGSFDECDNLDSQYSSMRGDSIPGEFDLEIVGSKLELPKVDALANIEEEPNKPVNASHLGSKITIGEPSGDVFGLTFDNNCNGIFWDDGNNEFLPINTLQTDN